MDNIDVRKYIVNNFKEDTVDDIRSSIDESVISRDDDALIGLGVLFEIAWNNSSDDEKNSILSNIKKGM